jgi:hypothetical protein
MTGAATSAGRAFSVTNNDSGAAGEFQATAGLALNASGPNATTAVETKEVVRLSRPTVAGIKYHNSAVIRVGSSENGMFGRGRLDANVNGAPNVSNNGGSIPEVTVMTLQGDGKVGIGTTTPGAALDVAGSIRVSGPITATGAISASGAVAAGGAVTAGGTFVASALADGGTRAVYADSTGALTTSGSGGGGGLTLPFSQTVAANKPAFQVGNTVPDGVSASANLGYGVKGASTQSAGVYGENSTPSKAVAGVLGRNYVQGIAVWGDGGRSDGTGGSGIGVLGTTFAGPAVEGSSQGGYGTLGHSIGGIGVNGRSGQTIGVKGESLDSNSPGVAGLNMAGGAGVEGAAQGGYGVYAHSVGSYAVKAVSGNDDAIHAEASTGGKSAVYAKN